MTNSCSVGNQICERSRRILIIYQKLWLHHPSMTSTISVHKLFTVSPVTTTAWETRVSLVYSQLGLQLVRSTDKGEYHTPNKVDVDFFS